MRETKIIYCGDEFTARFLESALKGLGFEEIEIFTIDGEYHLEVVL